ncbi:MAG: hypothetical protein MUP30_01600 [Deltaproteobacteria bacterium]|nr:hypothetical protein [Deltaproteobacteria bacterium]
MRGSSIKKEIVEKLDSLAIDEQMRVLDFTRSLVEGKTGGIAGRDLLRFAGAIEKGDLLVMESAIEEGCEKVDVNEW